MAPGCTNSSRKNRNVHYHRLPLKDKFRLHSWINAMKLKSPPITVHSRICSDHFEPYCYARDLKAELLGTKPRIILKDDAVPSLFDFSLYTTATVNATTTSSTISEHTPSSQ